MDKLIDDAEEKLKICTDIEDFRGPKFKLALCELNHVFQEGSDEASAKACKIVINDNILEHLTTLWQESIESGSPDCDDTITTIKALIWNCSDRHRQFVKLCVTSDRLFQLIIDDLKSTNPKDIDNRFKRNGVRADLGILHNLLRQSSSAPAVFRDHGGLDVVTSFTDADYHIIRIFAIVVLAYCSDSSVALNDDDCTFLINVMDAAHHSSANHVVEQGLTLEEILQLITKLITGKSDRKNLMIKCGVLQNIDKVFDKTKYSEAEIVAGLELLWELAVTESSKQALVQHQRIIQALDKCIEAEGTHSESTIRKESSSLSFLLKSPSPSQNTKKKHVMISYQWDSQPVIWKLAKYLEDQDFEVWLDVNKMKGSILTSMAEAVENAAIMILGVTEKYGDSASTKKEAQYADQKKIPMVPVMLEKGFEPSGWLGILIAGQLYVNLSEDPEDKFELVRKQIENILSDVNVCKTR